MYEDRSSWESRWNRHALAVIARADRQAAPFAGESVPEWRRRAAEQVRQSGHVAVWVTSGQATAL